MSSAGDSSAAPLSALHAPLEDATGRLWPDRAVWPELTARNRERFAESNRQIGGCKLPMLREAARREVVRLAVEFAVAVGGDTDGKRLPPRIDAPWIVTGHQPEMFHPGVWFKDFVADAIARDVQGFAIHVITDQDLARQRSIRIPSRDGSTWRMVECPFDQPGPIVPHEEHSLADEACFATWGDRVAGILRDAVAQPLVTGLWPEVMTRIAQGRRPGIALSGAYVKLGNHWGLNTWGVPLSALCGHSSFARFVWHFLSRSESFLAIHNDALDVYRHDYHLRSRTHPVPELEQHGDWVESPFWIWSEDRPERRRLFARQSSAGIQLWGGSPAADNQGSGSIGLLAARPHDDEAGWRAVSALQRQGIKLRPRALTTTLFLRLAVSDLFVHGIGGAKYDRLTDRLCEEFLGISPPTYSAATATFRLPLAIRENAGALVDGYGATIGNGYELASGPPQDASWLIREITYHPESFWIRDSRARRRFAAIGLPAGTLPSLDQGAISAEVEGLLAEKQEILRRPSEPGEGHRWNRALRAVNAGLGVQLLSLRERLMVLEHELRRGMTLAAQLRGREYPFLLFPESSLRPALLDLAREGA